MNKEIKEKWVIALKSGEYKQGTDCLKKQEFDGKEKYCCLGVLCDIYRKETGKGYWKANDFFIIRGAISESEVLPKEVQEWSGVDHVGHFTTINHMTNSITEESSLALINDNEYDGTFTKVIEMIEKYF